MVYLGGLFTPANSTPKTRRRRASQPRNYMSVPRSIRLIRWTRPDPWLPHTFDPLRRLHPVATWLNASRRRQAGRPAGRPAIMRKRPKRLGRGGVRCYEQGRPIRGDHVWKLPHECRRRKRRRFERGRPDVKRTWAGLRRRKQNIRLAKNNKRASWRVPRQGSNGW